MRSSKIRIITAVVITVALLISCAHKSGHDKRERMNATSTTCSQEISREQKIRGHAIVNMEKQDGVYYVPIKVNGLDLKFIFDTGASSISLSSAEALVMIRQGLISEEDIVGQEQFQDATGGISAGTKIRLRTIEIGNVILRNVEATIVDNIQAPLLLGQTALSKFGKVTIDYNKNTIEFN